MPQRVVRLQDRSGKELGWAIECPACACAHRFDTRWRFNGVLELPTFEPSLITRRVNANGVEIVCHSAVIDGKIQFLLDSTHEMAGLVIVLPEVLR